MLMKKSYLKLMALSAAMLTATGVQAVEFPYAQTPTDGQSYILASRSNPTNFWTRTSWDGAYYVLPLADAQNNLGVFTAHKAEDGTWFFTVENGEEGLTFGADTFYGTTYVGIPYGTDNLHGKLAEPAYWTVEESDVKGFYQLKAGQGQENDLTIGGYLHMNGGNQYAIINESSNSWFPDVYGGVQRDEDGAVMTDESGLFPLFVTRVSCYWAFLSPDDVPAYALKIQLYAQLQDIEDNYLALDGFQAGFQGAMDAALPYYNKAEFTQEDLDAAKVIITAKMNLYKEIVTAQNLLANGTPSSQLSDAIAAATKTFNESNDTAALEAALADLKAAEKAYAEGSGDLTPLVTNNSFEDLSSQNGAMTTGVAGAPYGWNVFVRGKQVTTADEVRAAGITAWHGINDDADGKEGDYAFGLWTSGVPEYEVSQTLTGLDNGSYTIAAAVMVGANGNGSRRTTQRIFGNLNAKYFGSDYEYDESLLDQSEVYGFEGLEEPVTDRQLQEMTVRAFVYDGTLTFGLRTNGDIAAAKREAANGAGGDGWFKMDNFRVYKEGYIQEDALAVYQHFANLYDNLTGQQMQRALKEQALALIEGNIGTSSSQEEIINAIVKLKELYPAVQASAKAYTDLQEAINKGYAALLEYPLSSSADQLSDLLYEAEDMYDLAEADNDEISDMIAKINEGIELLKSTAVTFGDITFLVKNPSFEDMSNQGNTESNGSQPAPAGWTLKIDGEVMTTAPGFGWCAINRGDDIDVTDEQGNYYSHQYTDGEHVWGVWNGTIPEIEISQTLKNMPAGTYTLQADVMVQNQWAGNCLTTQRLFANNYVQMWGTEGFHEVNLPADAREATVLTYAGYTCEREEGLADNQQPTSLLKPMSVTFEVGEEGLATIGFRTNGIEPDGTPSATCHGWFKLDNFRLSYDSAELTAVSGVKVQSNSPVTFYTIDGRQLQAPQRGLNIMKTGDKTVKILVK